MYFFELEELRDLFGGGETASSGPVVEEAGTTADESAETNGQERPNFHLLNLGVDRRMLVNRQRKLKMYRCWMQGHFQKPL